MSSFKDDLLAQAGGDPLVAAIATTFRLMQGDLATFKAGYSLKNATLAAAELFSVDVVDVAEGVQEAMNATMETLWEVLRDQSPALENTQEEPSGHCYTVLQDHGARGGGWGPAVLAVPGIEGVHPFVYTGDSRDVIRRMTALCRSLAQETGKPTRFVRFTQREDVAFFGGSS